MTLTYEELKTETDNLFKDRTLQDWKDQSVYRGITQRSQADFDYLIPMYIKKTDKLMEMLVNSTDENEQAFLTAKIARIKDKFATCCQEVKMRDDGDVIRTALHDQADYYIDYDNGNDSNDGLSTGNAWKTITKYTTTTVRTPGDRAFLRANIVWDQGTEAVSIGFDEDGTNENYISIIGCDSVNNDPWSDGDDTLPIIDFEDATYGSILGSDDYWYFERIILKQSNYSSGCIYCNACFHIYFKTCTISDQNAVGIEGILLRSSTSTFENCTFIDNNGYSIYISDGGYNIIKSCTFNGGSDVSTNYGIYMLQGGTLFIEDSTFGITTSHDNADLIADRGSVVYAKNCTWTITPSVANDSRIYSEDDDANFESQVFTVTAGTVTRGTSSPRSGGADSFAIMAPSSSCGPNNKLTLSDNPLSLDFKIWLSAAEHTVTIYARDPDDWATQPGNSGGEETFYIQASYLSNGASAARSLSTKSAQDTVSGSWIAFTTTFTMAREGWAYIGVYLATYEAGKTIEVDIKPVVS
ncbi:MAG: right-handed parallel beta-helix repeat-containing protein [Thermoplasmata archaeon]|nr:MAG: right-handed parallel beta-helix repeat-containing protein [Thermoplasmata archaeon]